MPYLRMAPLVALLLTSPIAAQQSGSQAAPQFRLPNSARPIHYALDLTIQPDQPTFRGTATIDVELAARTAVVWLNARDLTVSHVDVKSGARTSSARSRTSGEFLAVD